MSQSSLLEDIQSWDCEKCRQRVEEVLPKLIAMYTNGCTMERKVSLLGVMVGSFVPVIDPHHLETKFIAQVFPETQKIYDALLTALISALEHEETGAVDLEQTLREHLQMIVDLLTPMESTLQHILRQNGGSFQLSSVRSAPVIIACIIRRSFDHCKDSNIIYGSHFEALSNQLSSFFKKTYTLQKALTALLDVVQSPCGDGDMNELMAKVCSEFHDICSVISNMDTALMASTWKFLVKFVTKHKECLLDSDLQVPDIVSTLCTEIRSHFKHCLTQAPLEPRENNPPSQGREHKVFSKTVKVCGLLAKMLIHLLKEFDTIHADCSEAVLDLVEYLHSHSPPSLTAPAMRSDIEDVLKRSFLVCLEPLLQQFIPCRKFYESLLSPSQNSDGDASPFGHLLTLMVVLRLIPQSTIETQDHYHAIRVFPEDRPRESIVKRVLQTTAECYPEFTRPVHLPGIVQARSEISLHEYVVTHLNGFVATVTADQFSKVEQCLLEAVMSNSFPGALVAIDVWCFIARYGTAELCASHCQLLANLVKSFPSANQSPAYLLLCLQRLAPLMADASKVDSIKRFPVEDNISLWSRLPLHTFTPEHRQKVCPIVTNHSCQQFEALSQSSDANNTMLKLLEAMTDLSRLFHQYEPSTPPLPAQTIAELARHLLPLLLKVSTEAGRFEPVASAACELSSHLLLSLTPQNQEKVLRAACSDSLSSTTQLQFSRLSLLNKLGKLNLSGHPQQQTILPLIPRVFSSLLASDNPVVQHLAMVAFSRFAEETVHEELVPECLQDEATQERVVEFLNQTAVDIPKNKSEVDWLRGQAEILQQFADACSRTNNNTDPTSVVSEKQEMNESSAENVDADAQEPKAKKLKLDCERLLQTKLSQLSTSVEEVRGILADLGYKPPWLDSHLDQLLGTLITMKQ